MPLHHFLPIIVQNLPDGVVRQIRFTEDDPSKVERGVYFSAGISLGGNISDITTEMISIASITSSDATMGK